MRLARLDRTVAVHGILRCCRLSALFRHVRYSRDRSVRQVSVLLLCVIYADHMETINIPLASNHSQIAMLTLIEQAISDAGLLADRLELRSYPGATHWHIRRLGTKGTLELTYWPMQSRLWF